MEIKFTALRIDDTPAKTTLVLSAFYFILPYILMGLFRFKNYFEINNVP